MMIVSYVYGEGETISKENKWLMENWGVKVK